MTSPSPHASMIRPEAPVRVDLFARLHPLWYEEPGRHCINTEFVSLARRIAPNAKFTRNNVWMHVEPPGAELIAQGWKIHLSATRGCAHEVLRKAAETCQRRNIRFKFVADGALLTLVNSKMWPRESHGKFVVIYPRSVEEFKSVGHELDEALGPSDGPFILSDRRFGKSSCVYYRYGGFVQRTAVRSDGTKTRILLAPNGETVADLSGPWFRLPPGVVDPLNEGTGVAVNMKAGDSTDPQSIRIAKRFVVRRSLHSSHLGFTSAGGVYEALDASTGVIVALKEARPHIGNSPTPLGLAVASLEREFEVLRALEGTGVTPRPIALVWDSGQRHRFLAEELIDGVLLGPLLIGKNPALDTEPSALRKQEYRNLLYRLWLQLAVAVERIHSAGVCIGDLSLMNVMVERWAEDPTIRIIDLEGSWFEGQEPSVWFTPGYADLNSGIQSGSSLIDQSPALRSRDKRDDLFALGRLFLGCLFPATSLAALDAAAAARVFQQAASIIELPQSDFDFILRLTGRDHARRPDAREIVKYFSLRTVPPSLTVPSALHQNSDDLAQFAHGLSCHILEAGETTREDRVFPADPKVFSTNGVNLTNGIAGVLHSLTHYGAPIPVPYRSWLLSRHFDPDKLSPGLFSGLAGISAVLAEMNEEDLAVSLMRIAARHRWAAEDPFAYGGTAGIGLAALWLHGLTENQGLLDDAVTLGDGLCRDGRKRWVTTAGDTPIGLLYGTAGISLFLLYLSLITGSQKHRAAAEDALRITLDSHVIPDGRDFWTFPSYANKGVKRLRNYLADGSAGVGMALTRWISVTGDTEYESAYRRLLPDTRRNLTVFPSLLFGMSGMGMFHLDAYLELGDGDSLAAAESLMEAVRLFAVKTPTGYAMPGEQLQRFSTDFATGSAGVLLFASSLLRARQSRARFSFGTFPLPDHLISRRQAEGGASSFTCSPECA
jgi:serine/threonine protein kinase